MSKLKKGSSSKLHLCKGIKQDKVYFFKISTGLRELFATSFIKSQLDQVKGKA